MISIVCLVSCRSGALRGGGTSLFGDRDGDGDSRAADKGWIVSFDRSLVSIAATIQSKSIKIHFCRGVSGFTSMDVV